MRRAIFFLGVLVLFGCASRQENHVVDKFVDVQDSQDQGGATKDIHSDLESLNQRIESHPDDYASRVLRATLNFQLSDWNAAEADLNNVLEKKVEDGRVYGLRAQIYLNKGEAYKALADLNQAVRLNPSDGPLIALRGFVNNMLGNQQDAVTDMKKAVDFGVENSDAFGILAVDYFKNKDFVKSREMLSRLKNYNDPKYNETVSVLEELITDLESAGQEPKAKVTKYGIFKVIDKGRAYKNDLVASGEEWEGAKMELDKVTDKIPLKQGLVFGIDVKMLGFSKDRFVIFDCAISHPPIHKPDGSMTSGFSEPRQLECVHGICMDSSQYEFTYPYEMVPGIWTFQYSYNNNVIISKSFEVYEE